VTTYGYFLASEEQSPAALVEQARLAQEAGFEALWISDHYHPWNGEQGESPFVWSVIGALSQACDLPVTAAVTCPTVRINPAIVAQAAATSSLLLDGRFVLGVGSGEALNEHILGSGWPPADVRLEMLEEAIAVMRALFTGEVVSHRGRHYTVDNARLYSCPDEAPPIYVSGFGPKSTSLAARIGDGYVSTSPDEDLVDLYRDEGGTGPAQAGFKVSYAATAEEGRAQMHRLWPNHGLPGELAQILPTPQHVEQAATLVSADDTTAGVACGSDAHEHVEACRAYEKAGFDEVYVSQVGPTSRDFFSFYRDEVLPRLRAS
jgi:G6PDH family F420-dependent oxidoreductase